MAIANYAAYKQGLEAAQFDGHFTKNSATVSGSTITSLSTSWTTAPNAGAAPGVTARQCGRATAGNLLGLNPSILTASTLQLWLAELEIQVASGVRPVGNLVLVDRLADVSGLSGIVTTAQTVGTASSRYAANNGVFAALQIYTLMGATATTLTMSYTNQLGTAGKTSQAIAVNSTYVAGTIIPIPLADGDTGVQSVQTATLAATTGTAGSFGITLYKPLAVFPTGSMQQDGNTVYRQMMGAMSELSNDACLELWVQSNGGTTTGVITGRLGIIEG